MQVKSYFILSFLICIAFNSKAQNTNAYKPRIIITADPELDDNNSLVRFLLYSNEFKVEGLVYASSQFHWKGDGKGTKFMVPGREYTKFGLNLCPCTSYRWKENERFIDEAVEAYEKVYSNLVIHDQSYPNPTYLKSITKYGNIEFEGDFSKDTEGSDLIKAAILDNKPGPLFITAWGGQSTIARALKSIALQFAQTKNWEQLKRKISKKVVLLPSGDQDGTYASYIQPNWPDIDYRQYQKGPNYGYGAQLRANPENAPLLTTQWMKENITSKGALGAIYRVWGDGKQMVKGDIFDYFGFSEYTNEELKKMGYIVWMPVQTKGAWLGEGDTGTFLNMLNNGLNAWDHENPGGWSGRPFHPEADYVDPFSNDTTKKKKSAVSIESFLQGSTVKEEFAFPNFFPAAQNDFANRLSWSISNQFAKANHHPVIRLNIPHEIKVKAGEVLDLSATIVDPDGDSFTIDWAQFYKMKEEPILTFSNPHHIAPTVTIPKNVSPKQSIYILLTVKDNATVSLTKYQLIKLIVK